MTDRQGARFEALLEAHPDALLVIDVAGTIVQTNRRAEEVFGYARAELEGRPVSLALPGGVPVHASRDAAPGATFQARARRKDGAEFEAQMSLASVAGSSGAKLQLISLRERPAGPHFADAASLAALVEASDDAIIGESLEGKITSWNPGAEKTFGYGRSEAVGRKISILFPPGREHEEEDFLVRIRRGEPVIQYETVRRRKDGRDIDVSLTLSPVRDAAGTIVGLAKIARDITEQKRAAAALVESRAQLAQAQAVARLGSWEWDLRTNRVHWSDEMFQIYGYESRSFEPDFERAMERVDPQDAARIRADLAERVREFKPPAQDTMPVDYRINIPGDGTRLLRGTGRMMGQEAGKPDRMVGTVQDTTESRALEEQRQEVERLRRNDAFRAEFISKAAHELRTPLLPIRIQTHLLSATLGSHKDPKVVRSIEALERNLERLNRLIDDLLEASRVQSSRMALTPVAIEASDILDEVVESFQAVAQQVNVKLAWKPRRGVPIEVDANRIIQVLHNLLGNAMKFTPAGGQVSVELTRDPGLARIRIRDSGAGLSAEDLSQLFQPFSQTSAGRESRAPGTGLGLYVSKGIIELHKGRIWAESPGRGQGASFMVELPLTTKAPQPLTTSSAKPAWWRDGGASERSQRLKELI